MSPDGGNHVPWCVFLQCLLDFIECISHALHGEQHLCKARGGGRARVCAMSRSMITPTNTSIFRACAHTLATRYSRAGVRTRVHARRKDEKKRNVSYFSLHSCSPELAGTRRRNQRLAHTTIVEGWHWNGNRVCECCSSRSRWHAFFVRCRLAD